MSLSKNTAPSSLPPPASSPPPRRAWFGHVTSHDSLPKTILQGALEGRRHRDRQRKVWMENIKEWTSLYQHARTAYDGLPRKRLEKDLCWILPHVSWRPTQSREWTEVNRLALFCCCCIVHNLQQSLGISVSAVRCCFCVCISSLRSLPRLLSISALLAALCLCPMNTPSFVYSLFLCSWLMCICPFIILLMQFLSVSRFVSPY